MPPEENHPSYPSPTERILAINCGSSSLKFALYSFPLSGNSEAPEQVQYTGSVERIGEPGAEFKVAAGAQSQPAAEVRKVPAEDHAAALHYVLDWLQLQTDGTMLTAVGHRIVHGGATYTMPQPITDGVIDTVRRLIPLAPLHLPIELAAIEVLRNRYPSLPQVACFDTAFHRTMPRIAQLYGLPRRILDGGVIRYGFHGLSYEYIVSELERESAAAGQTPDSQRLVIAHLGNGASMVAVRSGRSMDTTMGLTPIGGLVMSTRSGDLDPGILVYLQETGKLAPADLRATVEQNGGLLGVSGSSSDMQDLLARRKTDQYAAEAVELFIYTARKHLGALVTSLGGLDCLVFTAGIGEHSPPVRQGICNGLAYMGISLDPERNTAGDSIISTADSPVTIRVMQTNEELMIARHTRSVVQRQS